MSGDKKVIKTEGDADRGRAPGSLSGFVLKLQVGGDHRKGLTR